MKKQNSACVNDIFHNNPSVCHKLINELNSNPLVVKRKIDQRLLYKIKHGLLSKVHFLVVFRTACWKNNMDYCDRLLKYVVKMNYNVAFNIIISLYRLCKCTKVYSFNLTIDIVNIHPWRNRLARCCCILTVWYVEDM